MARRADSSAVVETSSVEDIPAGTVIAGRYRVERSIGSGGMATIWECTHLALNRCVAVKFIDIVGHNTTKVRERFLREARVAAAVRHRNVIDIVDFGTTEDGRPFMVMELLVGRTLADRLRVGPAIGVAESVRLLAPVLSGLAAVHDAGIVHRDLKPENVFLVEDADGTFPKLLDFGVSRAIDPRGELESVLPTTENAIVGTPQYMSPEQARGLRTIDHRSDLWSAGVMLFELFTGVLPFDSDAVGDMIIQIATADPPELRELRPDLAGPLELVVKRAMQRRPDDRFQSAREMRAALLSAVAQTAAGMSTTPVHRARGDAITPVEPRELLDAVGDAYEPGDSGIIDLGLPSFGEATAAIVEPPPAPAEAVGAIAFPPAASAPAPRPRAWIAILAALLVASAALLAAGLWFATGPPAGDLDIEDTGSIAPSPQAAILDPEEAPEAAAPPDDDGARAQVEDEAPPAPPPEARPERRRGGSQRGSRARGLLRDPGF